MSSLRRKRSSADDDEDDRYPTDLPPSSPAVDPNFPPSSPPDYLDSSEERDEVHEDDDIQDLEDEEGEGEDLMGDNMFNDYKERDDEYYDVNDGNIDDNEYEDDVDARRRAEQQLNIRDKILQERSLPNAFLEADEDSTIPTTRRSRYGGYEDEADQHETNPENNILSLDALADVKEGSVAEWITQPQVNRSIAYEFKRFLVEFSDENGIAIYSTRVRILGENNSESLEVNYTHLAESKPPLAYFLAIAPTEMLKIFDVIAMQVVEEHYPHYAGIHSEIHVRMTDLPISSSLRDLRETHINRLIRVTGVVTRRTGVFPQLKYVKFDCRKCGVTLGPFVQEANFEVRVSYCHNCGSRGPFVLNSEKTLYRNFQKITLQESPGTVPAGRLPRHRDIILLWDLIDSAKPGEEVDVTGIYRNSYDGSLNAKNGFPVFSTVIEANMIQRRDAGLVGEFNLSEEEERQIRSLGKQSDIIDRIITSMAPSIYGHRDIKTAIACSLFGGVSKNVSGKHSIRGDINVLLLGDPGTAKSQFLKYSEKTSHRAVFATGQGASAVGLTASVRKDPITREWTLEGGALVLADKGTCLIDEFDKMNDQDRTSIHEAMEQQSISISKAGIVTTLQARCAIIAAANPNGGRYNATIPFSQNVDLTEPILSRFDILCVVRDMVNPEIDAQLATFVLESHKTAHPSFDKDEERDVDKDEDDSSEEEDMPDILGERRRRAKGDAGANGNRSQEDTSYSHTHERAIPQDLLRKYIYYARNKITPIMYTSTYEDKLKELYASLRRESIATGSYPITVRHFESIIRIAESFARMELHDFISEDNIQSAIKVTIQSFIGAQKLSVRRSLQQSFAKYMI